MLTFFYVFFAVEEFSDSKLLVPGSCFNPKHVLLLFSLLLSCFRDSENLLSNIPNRRLPKTCYIVIPRCKKLLLYFFFCYQRSDQHFSSYYLALVAPRTKWVIFYRCASLAFIRRPVALKLAGLRENTTPLFPSVLSSLFW